MKDKYTIDMAIELSLSEAKRKIETNKLFKSGDESSEAEDFTNGDPETLYTIASLYAQFVQDKTYSEATSIIEARLEETYPEFV